jgi:hypothetical protein
VTSDAAVAQAKEPTAAGGSSAPALWPFACASAGLVALGLAASFLLAPALRGPARSGLVAAAVGASVALPSLRAGMSRGTAGLLAGFSTGFLARMICVAAGLIASGARGRAALCWALSFFALYAATQAVEIAYVFASTRAEAREKARRSNA